MANKLPYILGLIFTVLSFFLCLIGFGTGHWWVSTDPESDFDRAGLWEVCFNGYEHTSDLIGKAYYGCWWIFYPEYKYIRNWLLPSWFIAVQTLMTFAVVFQFCAILIVPIVMFDTYNTKFMTLACIITGLITACVSTSVTIFGVMIGLDRAWLPHWHTNILGWSYGLVVLSGFFITFAFIALVVFTLMTKYEIAVAGGGERLETKKGHMPMLR